MKLIEIIATLIILTTSIFIIHGVPNDQLDTIEFGDVDVTQIKSLLLDLSSRVQHLEKKNDDLSIQFQSLQKKNQEVEERNYEMSTRISNLENEKKDVNDELEYLKELSKLNIVRTC